jgi:hypothetical protein
VVVVLGLSASAWVAAAWLELLELSGSAEVPLFEVGRGDFVRRIYADGNLEATRATQLTPPRSSRGPLRIAWLARDGSAVREGDVVIRFDRTDLEDELIEGLSHQARTQTRLVQRQAWEESAARNMARDVAVAEIELEHSRELQRTDSEIFPQVEIDESEIDESLATRRKEHIEMVRDVRSELAEVEFDLLELEQRQAAMRISKAQEELQRLELTAPHDGIFILLSGDGPTPEAGAMAWAGNPVAEIPQLEEMEAIVYVLEADAGGLQVGIPVALSIDAHPERSFSGRVRRVDTLAKRRTNTVPIQYFAVLVELDQTDPDLMRPGQRVQATLTLDSIPDAITVPRQAVFEKDGESVVYVLGTRGFEPVEVTLGATGLGRIVVTRGVAEGDVVALRDPSRPARPAAEPTPPPEGLPGTGVGS